MKNRVIQLLALIFFIIQNCYGSEKPLACATYDACGLAGFSTSNGINITNSIYSVTVTAVDSMTLDIQAQGSGCNVEAHSLSVNNSTINFVVYQNGTYSFKFGALAYPGSYKLHLNIAPGFPSYLYFNIYLQPNIVGVSERENSDGSNIKVFPCPASNILNITSENDPLTDISISDCQGKTKEYFAAGNSIEIPLDDHSPGPYLVRVATLSGRVFIKKITIVSP